jgi:hypothetical protein
MIVNRILETRLRTTLGFLCAVITTLVSLLCPTQAFSGIRTCYTFGTNFYFGAINSFGEITTPAIFRAREDYSYWKDGYLWVRTEWKSERNATFIGPDGKTVAPPIFGCLQSINPMAPTPYMNGGIASVKIGEGKYGYLLATGKILFEGGRGIDWYPGKSEFLVLYANGKYGYGDTNGNVVIKPRFDFARQFHHGMASVIYEGKEQMMNGDGTLVGEGRFDEVRIASYETSSFWVRNGKKAWLANKDGKPLSSLRFSDWRDSWYTEPTAFVLVKPGRWRVVDKKTGRLLSRDSFIEVTRFSEGLAKVRQKGGWGIVEDSGRMRLPCLFDDVRALSTNCSFAKHGRLWGLAGKNGKFIIEPQFINMLNIKHDHAIVTDKDWKSGVVSNDGRLVVPLTENRIWGAGNVDPDVAVTGNRKSIGLINFRTGKTILPTIYEKVEPWRWESSKDEDCYEVHGGGFVGLFACPDEWRIPLDRKITYITPPIEMKGAHGIFRTEDGVGLINAQGRIVLECLYEDVGHLSEEVAPAKQDGLWGYVDVSGKWVIAPRYEAAGAFLNGYATVKLEGKTALISREGKVITPFKYNDAGYVQNGCFPASEVRSGKELWGIVDLNGDIILPIEYDAVEWIDIDRGKTQFHGNPGWGMR